MAQKQLTEPIEASASGDDRPLRCDARRNRERVLAAAELVLGEQGLSAPIDAIAKRAEVGIGTVYRHFPTKQVLFEAVVHAHFEPLIVRAEQLLAATEPGPAFFEMIDAMVEASGHKAVAYAIAESDPEVQRRRQEWSDTLQQHMADLLARAQDAGAVRADVSYEDVRVMLTGTCMAHHRYGLDAKQRRRCVALMSAGLRDTSVALD